MHCRTTVHKYRIHTLQHNCIQVYINCSTTVHKYSIHTLQHNCTQVQYTVHTLQYNCAVCTPFVDICHIPTQLYNKHCSTAVRMNSIFTYTLVQLYSMYTLQYNSTVCIVCTGQMLLLGLLSCAAMSTIYTL